MAYERFDRWIQIVGALGIVAGLVLVGLQLGQSARLTRAELGSGSMSYRQTLLTSVRGEGLADALAQAIEDPSALDTTQQVILDAWYADVLGQVLRQRYLLRLEVFQDPLGPFAEIQARSYFGNGYAQAWWRRHRDGYPEELVALMDPVIEALPPDRDRRDFLSLREESLREESLPEESLRPEASAPR
ncbi:MAG: hypothetical protein V2J02_09305 [Pseudomonadales bacterium]|jgi:hypothetical protein|nr:hypothetical protein [Pseudomonadales bacterium]